MVSMSCCGYLCLAIGVCSRITWDFGVLEYNGGGIDHGFPLGWVRSGRRWIADASTSSPTCTVAISGAKRNTLVSTAITRMDICLKNKQNRIALVSTTSQSSTMDLRLRTQSGHIPSRFMHGVDRQNKRIIMSHLFV
jgi:hypothetical protein